MSEKRERATGTRSPLRVVSTTHRARSRRDRRGGGTGGPVGAQRRDGNADPQPIRVAPASGSPARVVGSRSHRGASLDAYLENMGDYDMVPMGSSLKFCVVAEGGADLYPRLGPTSEWDTAAAQAVVEQAGGSVVTLDGKPMKYNAKEDILNPHFFVMGATDRNWLALLSDSE